MYSENTVMKLNEIAWRYKDLMARSINAVLTQYSNTGAGAASVTVDVIEGTRDKSPVIQINFDDHVLYLDKRRMAWTKMPPIKKLMEWADTKTSDPKEAKRMAWGVAVSKRKTNAWKPKRWRRRSLSTVMKEMNQMLYAAYDRAIEQDFQQAINKA